MKDESDNTVPVSEIFADALQESTTALYMHFIEKHCKTHADKEILTEFVLVLVEAYTGRHLHQEELGR